MQFPSLHASLVVHALLSVHGLLFAKWVHPVPGLHPSVVHALRSSQSTGSLVQAFPTHRSLVVQAFASVHSASVLQQASTPVWVHPVADAQESTVQALPSSQSVGPPAPHVAPPHMSPVVQGSPSSHG
jgi:hypothetical protein